MIYSVVFLLCSIVIATFSLQFLGVKQITRNVFLSASSMGSDALERPDDESSPEFREYLRQLLTMQANRAKSGFVAPSSHSSDAYIAKLNRLKIEKLRRFRAGLPDDDLDYSYQPEDYQAAL